MTIEEGLDSNRLKRGDLKMEVCKIMKKNNHRLLTHHKFQFFTLALVLAAILAQSPSVNAQISINTLGVPYTQNFDTLPATGSATWTNNSTIPGWFHARTGTGTTIVANDGSSNGGNLYSYGTGTLTDRALGSLGSGNAAIGNMFWGVRLQNNSGSTINSLTVTYTGEQWRNSAAAAQTVSFSYLVGSPTVTGSLAEFQSAGTAVTQLDFTSPITGGTAGALDGNAAANRAALTFTFAVNVPNGSEIMLRWSDPDHTGADHGLSIDDFSVTPQATLAAAVDVNGRVSDADGSPIARAFVTLTDSNGATRTASTSSFGYFRFTEVAVGETYTINVSHKRYSFAPQVLTVSEEIQDLNLTALP